MGIERDVEEYLMQPPPLPPSPSLLKPGDRVGGFSIVAVTESSLTLKGHKAFSIGLILGGLAVTAFGVLPILAFLRGDSVSGRALFLPFLGIGLLVTGISQIGAGYIIDGSMKSLIITGSTGVKTITHGRLLEVSLLILPTNLQQRESIRLTVVLKPDSNPPKNATMNETMIGLRRTNRLDAINLIAAANLISKFLQIPIRCQGTLVEASPAMKALFAQLRV